MKTMTECSALKMYDEFLDEVFEPTTIAGYKYLGSESLKKLDPIAYDCGFPDWCDSEGIEIEE